MVGTLPADETCPPGIATGAVIGERPLERCLHGFGAGVNKEHAGPARAAKVRKLAGQDEAVGVSELERGGKVEAAHLFGDGRGDLGAPVTGGNAEEPGNAVEELAATGVAVVHPLGAHQ